MNIKDYIFLNRIIVVTCAVTLLLFFLFKDTGMITCIHLTTTGKECGSCGVTRDFLSFLNFQFRNSINGNSLALYIFGIIQLIYRISASVFNVEWIQHSLSQSRILSNPNKGVNGLNRDLSIKKVIITDAMITFVFSIVVFLPFWI